jgi:hypothetical protein
VHEAADCLEYPGDHDVLAVEAVPEAAFQFRVLCGELAVFRNMATPCSVNA